MMYIKTILSLVLTFSFLFSGGLIAVETPSERFMQNTSAEHIAETLNGEQQNHLPFLFEITAKESDTGFFGYHGSTQNFRIFQDVIRAVLEEKLNFVLPQDFYFFRLPGQPQYNFPNGMKDFEKSILKKNENKNIHKLVISTFLLEYSPLWELRLYG